MHDCLNLSEQLYVDVNIYNPDMSFRSIFLLPKKTPMPVQKLIGE